MLTNFTADIMVDGEEQSRAAVLAQLMNLETEVLVNAVPAYVPSVYRDVQLVSSTMVPAVSAKPRTLTNDSDYPVTPPVRFTSAQLDAIEDLANANHLSRPHFKIGPRNSL